LCPSAKRFDAVTIHPDRSETSLSTDLNLAGRQMCLFCGKGKLETVQLKEPSMINNTFIPQQIANRESINFVLGCDRSWQNAPVVGAVEPAMFLPL
jgi:hypothetical protein